MQQKLGGILVISMMNQLLGQQTISFINGIGCDEKMYQLVSLAMTVKNISFYFSIIGSCYTYEWVKDEIFQFISSNV